MAWKAIRKICFTLLLVYVLYFMFSCTIVPAFQKHSPSQSRASGLRMEERAKERICCIDDNEEALVRRLQIIQSAQNDLIFSTFHYSSDESGKDIMSALFEAAERGVNVRILVDGVCAFTDLVHSPHFIALAQKEHVSVKVYNPIDFIRPWKMNYRMHDKYIVADHRIALIGGRNTRNVSLGNYQEKKDIDRDILIYNPDQILRSARMEIEEYFEAVWKLPDSKNFSGKNMKSAHADNDLKRNYTSLNTRYPEAFETPDWNKITREAEGVALLANPIHPGNKHPDLWLDLCHMIECGEEAIVQTPYIICNQKMYGDMMRLSEHLNQFELITNSPETGANPCGCADFLNQKKNILDTGADIYEYAGAQSSHAKTILIDDDLCIVGSFNFDMRSTYLDTEMMLVIKSADLNSELREVNQQYKNSSIKTSSAGEVSAGSLYKAPEYNQWRHLLFSLIRIMILPLRHLL